jgi:hypothetical protein
MGHPPELRWRRGAETFTAPIGEVWLAELRNADPWRSVRSAHGQAHFAGSYWAATTRGLVTYESRLELGRLLLADWDPDVAWIVSQPFLIESVSPDGHRRRHIPDYLLFDRSDGACVVNVKPPSRLAVPKVAAALAWPQEHFARRGWRTEVWTGAPTLRLTNLRFLAGYRHAERCDPEALELVRRLGTRATTIGELEQMCGHHCRVELVRPAILHAVWSHELRIDIDQHLDVHTRLEAS